MISKYSKEVFVADGLISASYKELTFDIKTHWHDFFEIEFILDGGGQYIVDGIDYEMKPNMIFFSTPMNFHTILPKDTKLLNIMFTSDICSMSALSRIISVSGNISFMTSDEDANFYRTVINEVIKNKKDYDYCKSLMNCILIKLTKEKCKIGAIEPSVMQRASLYILENFRSQLTLEDVAKYVNLSPTYFSRIFKESTGVKFKEYLDSLRFNYAQNLIRYSKMSVNEICVESGFGDCANFIRRFKKRYGVSPLKYRELNDGNSEISDKFKDK